MLGIVTAALALTLGAAERGAADTAVSDCAGKLICASIAGDPDPASKSPVGTDHYLSYSVAVSNNGTTSNIVNITVTVTWADLPTPPATSVSTTSTYQPGASDSRCTETGTRTITCTTPKSLRPGGSETYGLVFRTSTTTDDPTDQEASGTNVSVTAAAKEQSKPNKAGNTAFVAVSNPTSYEGSADLDRSTAGGGLSTTLATAQVGEAFSSKLPVPSADAPTRGLFELSETSTFTCPVDLTCFGQQVTTVTTGLSPVNLQITYTGELPSGLNENSLVVIHERTSGPTVTIGAECSGEIFSGEPPSSEWDPDGCRRVRITHLPGGTATVEVDVWDLTNGRFIGGG